MLVFVRQESQCRSESGTDKKGVAPMEKSLAPQKGSAVTVRYPKGRKFMSIVGAAYNKARLAEEEAQRVNDTPGLPDLIHGFIAENRLLNKYKDEEVKSEYGYLSGYRRPKGITEQTNILCRLFLGVCIADEKLAERPLPLNADGWFAIPEWQSMAPTYGEAVQKVLDMIKKTRDGKFVNYREGQLGSERLRQTAKAVEMFQKLSKEQRGYDVLVVPAQFGIWHRGRSVRRAREVFFSNEFGLGAFANGIMLLTHSERLRHLFCKRHCSYFRALIFTDEGPFCTIHGSCKALLRNVGRFLYF
jgi:hypothetical protein